MTGQLEFNIDNALKPKFGRFGNYGLLPDDGTHYCSWTVEGEKNPPVCEHPKPCGLCERWRFYVSDYYIYNQSWLVHPESDLRLLWVDSAYVTEMQGEPDSYIPPKWAWKE